MENYLTVQEKDNRIRASKGHYFWEDELFQDYYQDYFDSLSTFELDQEFRNDLKILSKSLSKLSDSEKKAFINIISTFVQFYLEQKIEREVDSSFKKVFKFRIR